MNSTSFNLIHPPSLTMTVKSVTAAMEQPVLKEGLPTQSLSHASVPMLPPTQTTHTIQSPISLTHPPLLPPLTGGE